ncbi:MAG TPA: general secretion pathway protein, partial [Shigella sp.]|nr:general secretion pathway protein [Shigella sp.]
MLRDKFIHYFQQWRERHLRRCEPWLAPHLPRLSPRENRLSLSPQGFLVYLGFT